MTTLPDYQLCTCLSDAAETPVDHMDIVDPTDRQILESLDHALIEAKAVQG